MTDRLIIAAPVDRFWAKVDKRGPDECWLWTGATSDRGYGGLHVPVLRTKIAAHRMSWEIANGRPIPQGMDVCHSCDVRHCVNPAHLWLGTDFDNQRDAVAKGRHASTAKTHCPHGHEYSAENTYFDNQRRRHCRTCGRAASLRRYWKIRRAA